MPLKTKQRQTHHRGHKNEKRTKHFLKVYAPYIPLLAVVMSGIFLTAGHEVQNYRGDVKSYATNTSDHGLLEATNQARAKSNLPPLALNSKLDKAAQTKAEDMSQRNYWSHNTPDGKEPWFFINGAGYEYQKAAENLAYGFDTSTSTVNGWMNSPGHRANVLDPNLKEVGFGIINHPDYQGRGPETIVVAMYGQPAPIESQSVAMPVITAAADKPQEVRYVQTLTGGMAPWSSFAVGIVIGAILSYLTVKHLLGIRRMIRKGEKFILHHPLFDITLAAVVVLAAIVSQTAGSIY